MSEDTVSENDYSAQHIAYKIARWNMLFNDLNEYVSVNKKLPLVCIDKKMRYLNVWAHIQMNIYKNKTGIMKNKEICGKWKSFIQEYKNLFITRKEKWYQKFELLNNYVNEYKKLPSNDNPNLQKWCKNQRFRFDHKSKCMKDKEIYNTWKEFTKANQYLMTTNRRRWHNKLETVKIQFYKLDSMKNQERKPIMDWIRKQIFKYLNKTGCMKDQKTYDEWTKFKNEFLI